MDVLLVLVAALVVAAFLFLETRSLLRWKGGWRIGATLPLLAVLFVVARIVFDTRRDPTSHNLWPFEILFAVVTASVALGVLYAVQRASRTRTQA